MLRAMVGYSISFVLGVWLLQQQAILPDLRWAAILLLLPLLLSLPHNSLLKKIIRSSGLFILAASCGFFYSAWMASYRLAEELPYSWQGKNITLIGVVAEMPHQQERGQSFTFDVENILTTNAYVPQRILLSTYRDPDNPEFILHAGERWQLTVRLKQPHGTSNPYNFDFEAWALERNIRAVGYVYNKGDNRRLSAKVFAPGYFIEGIRETIRSHIQKVLGISAYAGILNALAIGDQNSIPMDQWQIFTRTGVNHLMSISGLHITMLASMAFSLTYWLWRSNIYLTLRLPARKAAATTGFFVALAYALISGYVVPAQRTVYMLGTVAAALWLSRSIAPSQLLAAALMVVLLSDPWSVMAPGFWLSFGAVSLIFYMTANRLKSGHWLVEYGRIQWAMSIGLIPPLLSMFQQISLVSPLANAFAIPLVSFVVVPLSLLGALLPFDWILHLAHFFMSGVMLALEWLNKQPEAVWTQHAPPAWSIAAGMIGVLWILLPRGFPARWAGTFLMLPMFMIQPLPPEPESLRLTIFDVGQGLSVAAQTSNHALLYDSGPIFNSESNSGNRILIPSLKGMGIDRLDKLVLSHNDADHTGGAISVLQAMPVKSVSSSLPDDSPILLHAPQTQRCSDGQQWDWDGVHFEFIHPALQSYDDVKIKNNDRGCVLRISTGKNSVLLTADIEKKSEHRLLEQHQDKLNATLLVVPHHGSKTSSTEDFVAAVHPRFAIFTAGYRNSFGHPKSEVVERYRSVGSELLFSDEDGAILVNINPAEIRMEKYRKTHMRYWHHKIKPQIINPHVNSLPNP